MKIRLNGSLINYVERGLPNGLPAVFIHGFPFNHEMWDPQMRTLSNRIRAISYDIRGHGASDVGDGQFTIELFVDDLIALLDHLVIDKAVLCGLSMGGYIALRAIERYPERVRALVLCDTKSEPDGNEAKIKRAATLKSIKSAGVPAFADEFVKSIFAPETCRVNDALVDRIRRMIVANAPLGISGTLLALAARTDTTPSLPAIHVPTLILTGDQDILTPPAAAEALHDRITGSRMAIVPKAGHMSNLENPAFFDSELESFLDPLT
jgi:3-oxoadipate enol-lactonase